MLYRLFVASTMLRRMKIKGRGTAHNYPKMILTQLLILEYWRRTEYYAVHLMAINTSIVNEELGEATFSLLGRAVLGDSCRSDFQHMRRIFKLIPIYREIKDDLHDQQGKKNTINWHHRIGTDDEAVNSTQFFFNRLIRGVKANWYKSYNGQPDCFANHEKAQANLCTDHIGLVYQTEEVRTSLQAGLDTLNRSVRTSFLSDHTDIWSYRDVDMSGSDNDGTDSDGFCSEFKDTDQVWGAPWSMCKPNWYAVSRSLFEGGVLGLALYQIVSINDHNGDEDEDQFHSFNGRQLTCSVDNCHHTCVREGVWKLHRPAGPVQLDKVFDWEVIVFFPAMNADHYLPSDVCEVIEEHGTRERLFGPQ